MTYENVYHDKTKKRQYFAGVLVSREAEILLGLKKRGFGSGLWNHSFAGKVEAGEATAAAARRELEEESGLRVEVEQLQEVARLEYEFTEAAIYNRIMVVTIYQALHWVWISVLLDVWLDNVVLNEIRYRQSVLMYG